MKNKPLIKKIVAGKFKGKTIKLPSATTTRSSKAIVLESFFNTIGFDIIDSYFVEVFSGSGSIGLEALSRGASRVIFMEQNSAAIKVLKENIAQTDPSRCDLFLGDSFSNIHAVVKQLQRVNEEAFFYIDPPFSIREGMEDIYEKMIALIAFLPKESLKLVIIEHMSGLELPLDIGALRQKKTKKFGNTSLTYYALREQVE